MFYSPTFIPSSSQQDHKTHSSNSGNAKNQQEDAEETSPVLSKEAAGKNSKDALRERREKEGRGTEHDLGADEGLLSERFPSRLRAFVLEEDRRVEPNTPRVQWFADEAVHRISDTLAAQLAVRGSALDRMVDLARLDGKSLARYADEVRMSNLALLLGDEAVQHDSAVHPSFKAEVRDKVRSLVWQTAGGKPSDAEQNPWQNN